MTFSHSAIAVNSIDVVNPKRPPRQPVLVLSFGQPLAADRSRLAVRAVRAPALHSEFALVAAVYRHPILQGGICQGIYGGQIGQGIWRARDLNV